MSELNNFTVGLIGFVAYPISKWLMIAIWDKICADCERDLQKDFDAKDEQ